MREKLRSSLLVFVILIIFMFTTGCEFNKDKRNDESFPDVEFSYNLLNWDKTIIFEKSPITLTLDIANNEAAAEFGIMVFINGISQEFMTNEYNESKYMQSYNIESKQQKSIQIILTPQNIEIGNYELVVIMLLNPSFMAKSPNYVFGYNHKISYAYTNIEIKTDTNLNKNVMTIEKSNSIDEIEKNKYIDENGNRLEARAHCIMLNDGEEENRKINLNGNNLSIVYKVLGGESAKYCVTTFINHEPILVNDKYDYVLLKSSIDTYSTFSCEYNNKKLQDKNVIYSIAIPVDNIKNNAFPIKSDSVIIIK